MGRIKAGLSARSVAKLARIEGMHAITAWPHSWKPNLAPHRRGCRIQSSVASDGVSPQQIHHRLRLVCAREHAHTARVHADFLVAIHPPELSPLDQREKFCQKLLRFAHSRRQRMRLPVWPSHTPACAAGSEMRPLNMPEVLVIERGRQRLLCVVKQMYGTVF